MASERLISRIYQFMVFFALVTRLEAAIDTSVCTPYKPGSVPAGPSKPILPKIFTARVECNILDKQKTTDVIEFYDLPNNRGAVYQTDAGQKAKLLYNYNTNELFTIDLSADDACHVDALSSDNNNFLFGYKVVNQTVRMFSPSGALRFGGNFTEKYKGKSFVRGIKVEGWESCAYWIDLDATSKVTWYFSDSTEWTEAIGSDRLPVRCEITGKVHDSDGGSRSYHHIYEFTHFRPEIVHGQQRIFETPRGVICKNRKSTKMVPVVPQYFRFDAEIIVPSAKIVSRASEWYDYGARLVRFDYSQFPGAPSEFGSTSLTEIHDFNTGVRYVVDPRRGNCTPTVIDPQGFDVVDVNPHTVRMRSAKQFFDFDGTFQYEGKHHVGGVECDVWIGTKKNFPPGVNMSQVEWYLATNDWLVSSGNTYELGAPKQMVFKTLDATEMHFLYNIYNYNKAEPAFWDFDISDCYSQSQAKHFQFQLPGSYKRMVLANLVSFKYAVLQAVVGVTGISPLRVSKIQLDYNEVGILVTFTMLDVAPITGDVAQGARETSLDSAANSFTDAVQNGQLVVKPKLANKTMTLTASTNYVKELAVREWLNSPIPAPPSGYRPGDMAAVAIVMIIVGFVLGGGILFVIYKKNYGQFLPKQFRHTNFDNSAAEPK